MHCTTNYSQELICLARFHPNSLVPDSACSTVHHDIYALVTPPVYPPTFMRFSLSGLWPMVRSSRALSMEANTSPGTPGAAAGSVSTVSQAVAG